MGYYVVQFDGKLIITEVDNCPELYDNGDKYNKWKVSSVFLSMS